MKNTKKTVLAGPITFIGIFLFLFSPLFGLMEIVNHFKLSQISTTILFLGAVELSFVNGGLLFYLVKFFTEKENKPVVLLVAALLPFFIVIGIYVCFWPMIVLSHVGFDRHSSVSAFAELLYVGAIFFAMTKSSKRKIAKKC